MPTYVYKFVDTGETIEAIGQVHCIARADNHQHAEDDEEIAEIENASEDAVKQRLKRGREKLKAILEYESSNKTNAL